MTISILKKVNFLSLTSTIASTLISAVSIFAAVNIDNRAKAVVVAGDPDNYIVSPGTGYDGVVQLIINRSDIPSPGLCTGSLLPTGLHILTAAHCLTYEIDYLRQGIPGTLGSFIARDAVVAFELPTQLLETPASEFYIKPDWNGDYTKGNDIAIIKLAAPAPVEADRYDIYRNTDEIGQVFTVVGYGDSGNGNIGATIPATFPGTKHYGQNIYESTSDSILNYVFENGLEADDALVSLGLSPNKGLGLNEATSAQGDSGGPEFINGLIAGITSYSVNLLNLLDVNKPLDYTYGTLGADTRVSSYASYIDDVLADKIKPTYKVPEPSTVFGSMLALGAFAINSRFRRKAKEKATK